MKTHAKVMFWICSIAVLLFLGGLAGEFYWWLIADFRLTVSDRIWVAVLVGFACFALSGMAAWFAEDEKDSYNPSKDLVNIMTVLAYLPIVFLIGTVISAVIGIVLH